MKLTATVPVPYFYYPGTTTTRRQRARRQAAVRRATPTLDEGDELAEKQEVVCAAVLGLSLCSTVALCLWQLAAA